MTSFSCFAAKVLNGRGIDAMTQKIGREYFSANTDKTSYELCFKPEITLFGYQTCVMVIGLDNRTGELSANSEIVCCVHFTTNDIA